MTEDWSNSDGVDYMEDMTASVESSGSTFGLGLGAGVDYYIFDNIYICHEKHPHMPESAFAT